MESPKRRDPRTATNSPRANLRNAHPHYTQIAEAATMAVLGACLAWFSLEWLDHSFNLAEIAGRRYVAAATAQGPDSGQSASPSPVSPADGHPVRSIFSGGAENGRDGDQ